MRQYDEAERFLNIALSIDPAQFPYYQLKSNLYLNRDGSTEKALETMDQALQYLDPSQIAFQVAVLHLFDGDYQRAIDQVEIIKGTPEYLFVSAIAFRSMGKDQMAEQVFGQIKGFIELVLGGDPENEELRAFYSLTYAGLGLPEEAVSEGAKALELATVAQNNYTNPEIMEIVAVAYIMAGEYDKALDLIEELLAQPSNFSVPKLANDVTWNPLHDHPRFQRLVEKRK